MLFYISFTFFLSNNKNKSNMKTTAILVPIDFTRAANNTINYVMGLSKQLKTKIVFVHIGMNKIRHLDDI